MQSEFKLKKELGHLILSEYVSIKEYQDKFYFVKKLNNLFPDIPDKVFYTTLDLTNSELKMPSKKRLFIRTFIEKFRSLDIR